MKKFYPTPLQQEILSLFVEKPVWNTYELREKMKWDSSKLGAGLSSLLRSKQIEKIGRVSNSNWIYQKT